MQNVSSFIAVLQERGGITKAQAVKVSQLYLSRKIGAARITVHDGVVIKHGAFLDRAVIRRAVASLEA